jgi:hypothetical protein
MSDFYTLYWPVTQVNTAQAAIKYIVIKIPIYL